MNYQKPMVVPVSKALLSTAAAVAAMVGVLSSEPAMAATVTYDFTVDVYTGAYVGKYNGSFSYESSSLISCSSNGLPASCATPTDSGLTVKFDFLENTFTEKQDVDYHTSGNAYPKVYFPLLEDSKPVPSGGLSFLVISPEAPVGFFVFGHEFRIGNTTLNLYEPETKVGNVSYTLRLPIPDPQHEPTPDPSPDNPPPDDGGATAVPEPSEIGGSALALGLLGIAWYWRRRKATVIDPHQDR